MEKEEFNKEVEQALKDVKTLKEDYRELGIWPVLSSRLGQCALSNDYFYIFNEFPEFFIEDDNHKETTKISKKISEIKKKIKSGLYKSEAEELSAEENELTKRKRSLCQKLKIDSGNNIELRFKNAKYDLIREIKSHQLINQPEHMMRDAYIKVVYKELS